NMRIDAVAPKWQRVGIGARCRRSPRQHRPDPPEDRLLAATAEGTQIDWQDRGVTQPTAGQWTVVVWAHPRGTQIGVPAGRPEIGPEGDVFHAPPRARSAGVAARTFHLERRDKLLGIVVEPDAAQLLEGGVAAGVLQPGDDRRQVDTGLLRDDSRPG